MSESDVQTERPDDGISAAEIDAFIDRWEKSGGSELANFQMFANELCGLLGLPIPDPQEENEYNDYAFERRIDFKFDDGSTSRGRIDLYKRGCFVMEAKQSGKRVKARKADPRQPDLIPEDACPGQGRRGHSRRARLGPDDARRQAAGGGLCPRPAEGAWLAALHPGRRCRPCH